MARPDKAAAVAELTDAFRNSNAAVLTEYRGLTVAQLKNLRRNLSGNAEYFVVKNTLTRIAAKEAGVDAFDSLLQGPSAIAFISGDAVEVAKGLRDFAKTNPLLVIKGGVLDGKALSAAEINKLADLESREVLLAKLAGAMLASLSQAAALFQAPLSQAARTIEALRAQVEANNPAAAAPAAEDPAEEAPAPEPSAVETSAEAVAESPVAAEDPVAETPADEAPAE
jgi:large subunit ribosomal protein L10